MRPIGVIRSCYNEKFGAPRQPGLAPAATARVELLAPYNRAEAIRGLEGFSHIWVLFLFHQSQRADWKSTVRPPRLGGNRRLGVFATRSTFRPNPLGISAVALERIELAGAHVTLHITGVDMVDGTPVLDIKPYLPYADSIPEASGGFALDAPVGRLAVRFDNAAERYLADLPEKEHRNLRQLIVQTLQQDPRPAYLEKDPRGRSFGLSLCNVDLRWHVDGENLVVTSINSLGQSN